MDKYMKKILSIFCLFCAVSAQATRMSSELGVYSGSVTINGTSYSAERIYVLPGAETNTLTCVVGEQVLVNIPASSIVLSAQPISANYAITNGGFEGNWTNNEPTGWHSFASATGDYASFVTGNTGQFQQSTDKRPGSTGSYSAQIQSKVTLSVKANGNCTNGRINAGSMSATDASGNYAFSDPSQSGYNTPFVGQPDSLVFWAKYVPGGGSYEDASNKARAHATLITNSRYQDPETGDYSAVKIAEATSDYSATSSLGWQRISVPFVYTSVNPAQMAYMLITFTTNKTPGGGNSTKKSPDNVYIDDAELIYNYRLTQLTIDGEAISFSNSQATTEKMYSNEYAVSATTNGRAAKTFVGYDSAHYRMYVYVVADNYSQVHAYSLYTIQMAEPIRDTEYAYAASSCDNEPYSDELFANLTESGEYHATIPNTQGGDSLITLTLTILPTYTIPAEATIKMNESYTWREHSYSDLNPGVYHYVDSLKTQAGCDSIFTLALTVQSIGYWYEESMSACVNEENIWHGKTLPTATEGVYVLYDSLQSIYGQDSIYKLTLSVHHVYLFEEEKYVNEANLEWRGKTITNLPKREEPYLIYDSLSSQFGCDSVYLLRLHVSDIPITYGNYADECCEGEVILFAGVEYRESFEGDVRVSERNIYGGDSIVHLTITVFPSYFIEEEMTIVVGEEHTWEYYDLSQFPIGTTTLKAEYWSEEFCDSTMVLHLTIEPKPIGTGIPTNRSEKGVTRKIVYNGQLYIIREDESIYDILGNKIQ